MKPPLFVAMCSLCKDEHRHPETVGVVWRHDNGRVNWYPVDRKFGQQMREAGILAPHNRRGGQALEIPSVSDVPIPERLYAFCRNHGQGSVASSNVVGKRGRVVVNFTRLTSRAETGI